MKVILFQRTDEAIFWFSRKSHRSKTNETDRNRTWHAST